MQHKVIVIDETKRLMYAWFVAMFTRIDVVMVATNQSDNLIEIATNIQKLIEKTEHIGNKFDAKSELAQLNKLAFYHPVAVSQELFQLVDTCLMYHTRTKGLFDITINSTNGYAKGAESISMNSTSQTIAYLHPDVQIDLSGFLKGYVLCKIKHFLMTRGIENALINMGNSSILAMGNHPVGNGWKIRIANSPTANVIVLNNQCLTTSGNQVNSKWPVLKPQAKAMPKRFKSISVITTEPDVGEVLSTALYVATQRERKLILNQFEVEMIENPI